MRVIEDDMRNEEGDVAGGDLVGKVGRRGVHFQRQEVENEFVAVGEEILVVHAAVGTICDEVICEDDFEVVVDGFVVLDQRRATRAPIGRAEAGVDDGFDEAEELGRIVDGGESVERFRGDFRRSEEESSLVQERISCTRSSAVLLSTRSELTNP